MGPFDYEKKAFPITNFWENCNSTRRCINKAAKQSLLNNTVKSYSYIGLSFTGAFVTLLSATTALIPDNPGLNELNNLATNAQVSFEKACDLFSGCPHED